jgi:hypothetical protein
MTNRFAVLAASAILFACADYEPLSVDDARYDLQSAVGPTVMSRNVYLGGDLDPVIGATSPQQVPLVAAQAWAQIQASNFPARAGALAAEIVEERPHLVGLQEVSLYQVQSPSDLVIGGTTPATAVAYDFLQLLLDSLAARGADYRIVASVTNTSVEVPVYTGRGPIPFDDVRYTDHDVILARADVATTNPQAANFAARINTAIGGAGGPPVSLRRGWTSVDATVYGRSVRFANTHLEVERFAAVQTLQAAELIGILTASSLPVVAVGDYNSNANMLETATYAMMLNAGFEDMWQANGDSGYTCCQDKLLRNEESQLVKRIDFVFARGFSGTVIGASHLVGDEVTDRLASGLWPSDHAGVVTRLRLPAGLGN